MSTFDLERAKAGEPVQHKTATQGWIPVHFVGLSEAGSPVIERKGYGTVTVLESSLRMAPKKVTVRYRVALCQGAHSSYVMAVQEGDPEPQLTACGFIAWLGEWQTVEIQPDLTDKETR